MTARSNRIPAWHDERGMLIIKTTFVIVMIFCVFLLYKMMVLCMQVLPAFALAASACALAMTILIVWLANRRRTINGDTLPAVDTEIPAVVSDIFENMPIEWFDSMSNRARDIIMKSIQHNWRLLRVSKIAGIDVVANALVFIACNNSGSPMVVEDLMKFLEAGTFTPTDCRALPAGIPASLNPLNITLAMNREFVMQANDIYLQIMEKIKGRLEGHVDSIERESVRKVRERVSTIWLPTLQTPR